MAEKSSNSTSVQRDELDQFLTRKRSEVVSNLLDLSRNREPLTVLLESGRHSFPTTVIGLITDNTEVVIERANKEEMNARLLKLQQGTVVGQPGGIKIRFVLEQITEAKHEGEKVFVAPLPTEHYRMQRRALFRIDTQLSDPVQVDVPLADGSSVTLTAGNISNAGLRLNDPDHILRGQENQVLTACSVKIPEVEPFPADLVIRNSHEKTKLNGKSVHYVGCEFENLHNEHQRVVQSYIHRLQLAELAVKN